MSDPRKEMPVNGQPQFKEPTFAVNDQLQQFFHEMAGWRSDKTSIGTGPDAAFQRYITEHPDLLTHYVEIKNPVTGQMKKTHLAALLWQEATSDQNYRDTYYIKASLEELRNPSRPRAMAGKNYWPLAQLFEHPAGREAMMKASFDAVLEPRGVGGRVPLGEKLLECALKDTSPRHYPMAAALIEQGVPVERQVDTIFDALKPLHPGDSVTPRVPLPADIYKMMADALATRKGDNTTVDLRLLELVIEHRDYDRAAQMIKDGYPLDKKDDKTKVPGVTVASHVPSIVVKLREDEGIPREQADALTEALRTRAATEPGMLPATDPYYQIPSLLEHARQKFAVTIKEAAQREAAQKEAAERAAMEVTLEAAQRDVGVQQVGGQHFGFIQELRHFIRNAGLAPRMDGPPRTPPEPNGLGEHELQGPGLKLNRLNLLGEPPLEGMLPQTSLPQLPGRVKQRV